MMDLKEEVEMLLEDHVKYHEILQIDAFIIGRRGFTDFGRYKQALRELATRKRALQQAFLDLGDLNLDIAELEVPEDGRAAITLARLQLQKQELEFRIKETGRELSRFFAHAKKAKTKLGDISNPAVRNTLYEEWFMINMKFRCALEYMTGASKLPTKLLRTILALPDRVRAPIMRAVEVGRASELTKWAQNLESEELEEAPELPLATLEAFVIA